MLYDIMLCLLADETHTQMNITSKDTISPQDVEELISEQIKQWATLADNISQLNNCVKRRHVGAYVVQWNPARAVSTMAKVDKDSLESRPCFLCNKNRPIEQVGITILNKRWEILANPFPILKNHLTIASTNHEPQILCRQDFDDMVAISKMLPEYYVFYNGAHCGASAPDHKHLQAGILDEELPIWKSAELACLLTDGLKDGEELWHSIEMYNSEWRGDGGTAEDKTDGARYEADFNVIMKNGEGFLIARRKHRPDCYSQGHRMVSPGSLDMAGLIIVPRERDYNELIEQEILDILRECGRPKVVPMVRVGIAEAPKLNYERHDNRSFTLKGVTIGKNFHWQRSQSQTFRGELEIVKDPNNGYEIAVNNLPVEEYLLSVISSEMSNMSSLELLKAHAVISRTWLMRILQHNEEPTQLMESVVNASDVIIRWYDNKSHNLYDVCADDHCQRYQGISGVNPTVVKAIWETMGEVLVSRENELCDTRFSKCCGGRTERFSTCWQDTDYDYLSSVECPYCNTKDEHLLHQILNSYDQSTIDFHNWTIRYSQQELSELIEAKLHKDLGIITNLVPLKRGDSGRISLLKIVGTNRTITIGKELEIRRVLSTSHLYSSNFTISRESTDFILNGHGWGHGVGLCQIGAAVMADQGNDYKTILTHYYPGSKLLRIRELE